MDSPLDALARSVTLGLAGLAQASLKVFEKLGVDMTSVDQAIADWTQYAQDLKAHGDDVEQQLSAASDALTAANEQLATIAEADALKEAQDIAAAVAQANQDAADKLEAALESLRNPPVTPPDTPPTPDVPPTPDTPPPDVTPPTDVTPPDTPPADSGGGDVTPPDSGSPTS
jgi:hypothetical protein